MPESPATQPRLLERFRRFEGFDALIAIALWKLGTFATAFIAWSLLPFNQELYTANYRYGARTPDSFLDAFNTWDSQHFIRLAERGYEAGNLSNAFGPLYPMLIRGSNVLAGDSIISGLIVANVASALALFLLYRLVSARWDRETGFATLLLCMAFPTAFYLNLVYTEALFLFLLVALFYALYERRMWIAALAGFLLPLLRVPGLIALVPMVWILVVQATDERTAGRGVGPSSEGRIARLRRELRERRQAFRWRREMAFALAPMVGLGVYLLYMHFAAGNAFIAMDTEKLFISERGLDNLLRPGHLIEDLFRSSYSVHDYLDSAIDRIFFVVFVLSLPLVYRRVDTPMFLVCAIIGLQPLLGSFMSYTRLMMVAFPLYIAYAATFVPWRPKLTYAIAYPMLSIQAVLLAMQVTGNWVA